jgi:hypothetical protein
MISSPVLPSCCLEQKEAAKPAVEDAEALEERLAKEEKKKANEHPLKIMDA